MADQIFARVRAHLRPQTVVLTEARKALKGLARLESTLGQLDLETRVGDYERALKSSVETALYQAITKQSLDLEAHEYLGEAKFGALGGGTSAATKTANLKKQKQSLYYHEWQAALFYFVFDVADDRLQLQARSLLVRASQRLSELRTKPRLPLGEFHLLNQVRRQSKPQPPRRSATPRVSVQDSRQSLVATAVPTSDDATVSARWFGDGVCRPPRKASLSLTAQRLLSPGKVYGPRREKRSTARPAPTKRRRWPFVTLSR